MIKVLLLLINVYIIAIYVQTNNKAVTFTTVTAATITKLKAIGLAREYEHVRNYDNFAYPVDLMKSDRNTVPNKCPGFSKH